LYVLNKRKGGSEVSNLVMFLSLFPLYFTCLCAYKDAIAWSDVTSLTLRSGQLTTGRRVPPVQQLLCIGGTAATDYAKHPELVQCTQTGFDGVSFQYKCEASLNEAVKFGQTKVSCEGYNHKDDSMVLIGSCALRYTLEYTPMNNKPKQQQQQKQSTTTTTTKNNVIRQQQQVHNESGSVFIIITALFTVVVTIGIMSFWFTKISQQSSFSAENEYQKKKRRASISHNQPSDTDVRSFLTTPLPEQPVTDFSPPTPSSLPQPVMEMPPYYTSIPPPVQPTPVYTQSPPPPQQQPPVVIVNNSPPPSQPYYSPYSYSSSSWLDGYSTATILNNRNTCSTAPVETTTTTTSVKERVKNYNDSTSSYSDTYKATTYCGSEGR